MAFLQVQFFSQALGVASTVNVILPEHNQGIGVNASGEQVKEPPKVLYLLHGYSDDHSIWMRRTSVERYAAAHNLAVIMPAVNHSFYNNEVHGERYWDYVSDELPTAMHRFFKLSEKPEDTFVAGLSMGGYGAMKLALTFPERYAAAASFSGALDYAHGGTDSHVLDFTLKNIFGDENPAGTDADLFYLMKKNQHDISDGRTTDQNNEHLYWIPIAEAAAANIVPAFLRQGVQNLPTEITHVVSCEQ